MDMPFSLVSETEATAAIISLQFYPRGNDPIAKLLMKAKAPCTKDQCR